MNSAAELTVETDKRLSVATRVADPGVHDANRQDVKAKYSGAHARLCARVPTVPLPVASVPGGVGPAPRQGSGTLQPDPDLVVSGRDGSREVIHLGHIGCAGHVCVFQFAVVQRVRP